ncbi:hypothetical protein T4E_11556 [Trichinella pseudospiralis]|uniref:Uncharacterized protein n=1 Tax=Trichinella pseudospiralis TaxID=6337 RepID=A0A0V0XLH2_TRIPS|nr:hypothetical protein T4E_11556 [Trichinella pseudospiralis]
MSSNRRSYKDTRRWILDRARMEEDANEISSWLLTASLKHPRSFERLLGSYRLLCEKKNIFNAAEDLGKLYLLYSHDSRVEWPVWSVFAKELAKRLVKRKKFHYPKFQQYIHCPMLIEIICNCVLKCEDVDFLLFEKRGAKRRKQDKKAQLYKQLQSSNVDISTVEEKKEKKTDRIG